MEYDLKDIDKVATFKSWTNKRKIDELLRIDCKMYTFLGIDSSLREKQRIKRGTDRNQIINGRTKDSSRFDGG